MNHDSEELAAFARSRRRTVGYKQEKLALEIAVAANKRMIELGLQRKALAKQLGVSPAYVTQLLSGKPNMTLSTIVKLASVLDLEADVRFYESRNPPLRVLGFRSELVASLPVDSETESPASAGTFVDFWQIRDTDQDDSLSTSVSSLPGTRIGATA